MHRSLALLTVLAVLVLLGAPGPAGAAPGLRAGAGQADLTPPRTGYFLGGWTRADRLALGQSSRLYANALVLQRGRRKVALVAAELFAVSAGLQEEVARQVADLGLDRTSILLAASHTHSGPGGFMNNPTYNTAAPSTETVTDPGSFVRLLDPEPADPQLYTFLAAQIAQAIRRAHADRAPAVAGWGRGRLTGLTQNRSIEAHLANHGIRKPYGQGDAGQDPDGVEHTIDPSVDVLRVDKLVPRRRGRGPRRMPIGAWSNFANHGTVVPAELQAYSGDHHAAAWRRFAARVRRAGRVPARQAVVNVYPNSDEGDQTAGIRHVGPAAAQFVGNTEADAMFAAWRRARSELRRRPALGVRWTRACFCGRETAGGRVSATGVPGIGFLTGSEEGRGPLHDETGVVFEGMTSPFDDPEQGNKVQVPAGDFPPAVPLAVLRVGDGAIASMPGEPTKEIGTRVRAAVAQALAPAGVDGVVVAGLAGDFIQYISTPEEYGQQSYEGASTLYGPHTGTFIAERLAELAGALAARTAAPEPFEYDASYGVRADGEPYPAGAAAGTITEQPAPGAERLTRASLAWTGGASGSDRPVDRAFVTAQRRVRGRWRRYADDLGLQFLWRADAGGSYRADWEIPLWAPAGRYRLVVTAGRYRLASKPFAVVPSTRLAVERTGDAVRLAYPPVQVGIDLTARPKAAAGGTIDFGGRTVRRRRAARFPIPAGATSVAAGAARDRHGNTNGEPARL